MVIREASDPNDPGAMMLGRIAFKTLVINKNLNNELNNCVRNSNDTNLLETLVNQGADLLSVNDVNWRHTPLHQACFHGRTEIAKTLIKLLKNKQLLKQNLEMKSNPCGKPGNGTPIELARNNGHYEIVKLITYSDESYVPHTDLNFKNLDEL